MSLQDKALKKVPAVVPGQKSLTSSRTSVARPQGLAHTALKNLAARNMMPSGPTNIGFVIDATASREDTWEDAKTIQCDMFNQIAGMGQMRLRLVHFGGDELTDRGYANSPDIVHAQMNETVCRGGSTQIIESLDALLASPDADQPRSIILVGDSFEEDSDALLERATTLADKKIKVYAFQEGDESDAAYAFRMLAEKTGGAYAVFGADMPLKELCQGVALQAIGGNAALFRLNNAAVRNLLTVKP